MDIQSEDIVQTIEGRHDLGYTRREGDKITAKKSADGKLVINENIYFFLIVVSIWRAVYECALYQSMFFMPLKICEYQPQGANTC